MRSYLTPQPSPLSNSSTTGQNGNSKNTNQNETKHLKIEKKTHKAYLRRLRNKLSVLVYTRRCGKCQVVSGIQTHVFKIG